MALPSGYTQSPGLSCAAVDANGNVTLVWILPSDSCGNFNSYDIYSSSSFYGPYSLAGSITSFFQNSYFSAGVNAHLGIIYYYVVNNSGCLSTVSDTLSTLFLSASNSPNGTNQLLWNPVSTGNFTGWYRIFLDYPKGTITLLDSVFGTTSYTDILSICGIDTARYFVEARDGSGCSSVSSTGILTRDILQPPPVLIDSVTVLVGSGLAQVNWIQSVAADIAGYIIYLSNPLGGWDSIDYVSGISNTTYTNLFSAAGTRSEGYSIAAVDNCGNTSAIGVGHNTIFLSGTLDKCSADLTLTWNGYSGWPGGVAGYSVYTIINGSDTLLGTTSATTFVHNNLTKDATFCYYVSCYDGTGKSSTSNRFCIVANVTRPPAFVYLNQVTVKSGKVFLSCYVDNAADVDYYKIQRSTDSMNFTLLKIIDAPVSGSTLKYSDNTGFPKIQSYYYRVIVVDSCGNEALVSNFGKTILLEADPQNEVSNLLNWTPYGNWNSRVYSYIILRSIDDVWDSAPLAIIQADTTQYNYTDDVYPYAEAFTGKFCYYVQAVQEPVTNPLPVGPPFFSDTSVSNLVCVQQFPKMLVPNTFTPDGNGLNDIFNPLWTFVDKSDFLFLVFNRYGQEIFRTTDPAMGWDGTFNDSEVQSGAYVYYFRFKVENGRVVEKTGTVTVLH